MYVKVGDAFLEPGAVATDGEGGTVPVVISGFYDTTTSGSYTLRYNATNAAGGTAAEVTRTIIVGAGDIGLPNTGPVTPANRNPWYLIIPVGILVAGGALWALLHGKHARTSRRK